MAIKGSLKEASLPDVIQLLFLGRRTGCLALADRHNFGTIYFEEGQHRLRRDREPAGPAGRHPAAQRADHAEQLQQAIDARRATASTSWARSWSSSAR